MACAPTPSSLLCLFLSLLFLNFLDLNSLSVLLSSQPCQDLNIKHLNIKQNCLLWPSSTEQSSQASPLCLVFPKFTDSHNPFPLHHTDPCREYLELFYSSSDLLSFSLKQVFFHFTHDCLSHKRHTLSHGYCVTIKKLNINPHKTDVVHQYPKNSHYLSGTPHT